MINVELKHPDPQRPKKEKKKSSDVISIFFKERADHERLSQGEVSNHLTVKLAGGVVQLNLVGIIREPLRSHYPAQRLVM